MDNARDPPERPQPHTDLELGNFFRSSNVEDGRTLLTIIQHMEPSHSSGAIMRRCATLIGVTALAATFLPGCEAADPEGAEVQFAPEAEAEIFGGSADTTHDAVVYLEGSGACTGTIIGAANGTGWVLTAGHCGGLSNILVGDTFNTFTAQYDVSQDIPHPQWNGNAGDGYDFRLLRFSYSGATPPVIPPATDDSGIIGQMVTHVGYGLTENGDASGRRAVNQPVQNAYNSPPLLEFDQSNGTGTCSGDSGGPAIRNNQVVGVTSFGDSQCVQDGYSGRVAAVSDWIGQYVTIGEPQPETCNDCIGAEANTGGSCASLWSSCPDACSDLDSCYANCADDACYAQCDSQYPSAVGPLQAVYDCLCEPSNCGAICGCTPPETTTTTGNSMNGAGGSMNGVGGTGGAGGSGNGNGSSNGNGAGDEGGNGGGDNADDNDLGGISCSCETPANSTSGGAVLAVVSLLAGMSRRRRNR